MTSTLFVRSGWQDKVKSLQGLIDRLADPPAFSWIEPAARLPKNGPLGALQGFAGVTAGKPDVSNITPGEVRLFWPQAAVQFVAGPPGLRWAAFATAKDHLPAIATSVPDDKIENLSEQHRNVIWRRDLARFIGRPDAAPEPLSLNLRIREFWDGPRLVVWWLVPTKG